MKVSHADLDYLKKDHLEKYVSVIQNKFCAYVAIFYVFHEIYFYIFYIPKEKKPIKIWHFRNISFMIYIIIKT